MDSDRNGFDAEYIILIDFVLGFFRFRTIFFITKNDQIAAFQTKYDSAVKKNFLIQINFI